VRARAPRTAGSCPPLADILSKLADAGLELTVDGPAVTNAHGVIVTDDDIPF
jgi:hypothetical protein